MNNQTTMNDNNQGANTPVENPSVQSPMGTPMNNGMQIPMGAPMNNGMQTPMGAPMNNAQPVNNAMPNQMNNQSVNPGMVNPQGQVPQQAPKKMSTGLIIAIIAIPILLILIIGVVVAIFVVSGSKKVTGTATSNTTTQITTSAVQNTPGHTTTANSGSSDQTTTQATPNVPSASVGQLDGYHFMVLGKSYTFYETKFSDIEPDFGYVTKSVADVDLLENRYTSQYSYPFGTSAQDYYSSGIELATYFVNKTNSEIKTRDAHLFKFYLQANGYTSDKSFSTVGGVTFDLGGGVNQTLTEEKALELFGKPDYEYHSSTYTNRKYEWRNKTYKVTLGYNDGGMYYVEYECKV